MPIWLILGIGAGVVVGGFALSKIIPAIIRSIQYRNRISKEQYEKNLAMIKEKAKEREARKAQKQAKKQAKHEARKQARQNRKARIAEAKQKVLENTKQKAGKLKEKAISAGKTGKELAGKARDKAVILGKTGIELAGKAKDKTSEMIADAKAQRKIQVIKNPQEHLPAPSPAQDQYEQAIQAKQEEIARLKQKSFLNKQEKETLQRYEREVLNYRMVNPERPEPTVIVKEKEEKQHINLSSPKPEYDLNIISKKMDRIHELNNQTTLTKEDKQEIKTLQKETEKFFKNNPDYQIAYLNLKVHESQRAAEQDYDQTLSPSQIEAQEQKDLAAAAEAFAKQNPHLAKHVKKFFLKQRKYE